MPQRPTQNDLFLLVLENMSGEVLSNLLIPESNVTSPTISPSTAKNDIFEVPSNLEPMATISLPVAAKMDKQVTSPCISQLLSLETCIASMAIVWTCDDEPLWYETTTEFSKQKAFCAVTPWVPRIASIDSCELPIR